MNETESRAAILKQVRSHYENFHAPKINADFAPGESTLPYAGRVYDAEEMEFLVDAALDFWLTSGRYTAEFEKSFAKKVGRRFSLLTNSGSSANLLAFSALTSDLIPDPARRIQKGDEIITVAAGFPTTITPILQYGAVPVFVDVQFDNGTYDIEPQFLEEARTSKTKAVILAHTLGNPFDLDAVTAFCKKYGLWLIEDNCDALGSTYRGKWTGTFGDLSTSSFYPPHHLTMGEGGAISLDNPVLRRALESFRDWGRDCYCPSGKDNTCQKRFEWQLGELPKGYDHKYIYRHLGFNLKATDLQAAIGVAQLKKLDSFIEARRKNWAFLRNISQEWENVFVLPNPTMHSDPSWFGFALSVRETAPFHRKEIADFLEFRKIQTRMLFGGNLLKHPAFDHIRKDPSSHRVVGELRNTDKIMNQTFWVGVYPGMTREKLTYIAESIGAFLKR